jgi:hypothetical protein
MTMIATPGKEQSAKGVATGDDRKRFVCPGHVRRYANRRFRILRLRKTIPSQQ